MIEIIRRARSHSRLRVVAQRIGCFLAFLVFAGIMGASVCDCTDRMTKLYEREFAKDQ